MPIYRISSKYGSIPICGFCWLCQAWTASNSSGCRKGVINKLRAPRGNRICRSLGVETTSKLGAMSSQNSNLDYINISRWSRCCKVLPIEDTLNKNSVEATDGTDRNEPKPPTSVPRKSVVSINCAVLLWSREEAEEKQWDKQQRHWKNAGKQWRNQ